MAYLFTHAVPYRNQIIIPLEGKDGYNFKTISQHFMTSSPRQQGGQDCPTIEEAIAAGKEWIDAELKKLQEEYPTVEEFRKLSLQELFSITRVSLATWSNYFNGKRLVTERTLIKAAPMLGMTPIELFTAIIVRRANPREIQSFNSRVGKALLRVLLDKSLFIQVRVVAREARVSPNLIVSAALRSFLSDKANIESLKTRSSQ